MQNSVTREELVSALRVKYTRMEDATCSCHKHQLCPVGFMGSCFMGSALYMHFHNSLAASHKPIRTSK